MQRGGQGGSRNSTSSSQVRFRFAVGNEVCLGGTVDLADLWIGDGIKRRALVCLKRLVGVGRGGEAG